MAHRCSAWFSNPQLTMATITRSWTKPATLLGTSCCQTPRHRRCHGFGVSLPVITPAVSRPMAMRQPARRPWRLLPGFGIANDRRCLSSDPAGASRIITTSSVIARSSSVSVFLNHANGSPSSPPGCEEVRAPLTVMPRFERQLGGGVRRTGAAGDEGMPAPQSAQGVSHEASNRPGHWR
jgi:hypothetical protein